MDEQKRPQEILARAKDEGNIEEQVAGTSTSTANMAAFKERRVMGLSVTHIIIGLICIAVNSILIALVGGWSNAGYGIWGGVVFLLSGSIGVRAVKRKTQCMITSLKLSSIVTAGVSIAVLGLAINAAVEVRGYIYKYECRAVNQTSWDGSWYTYWEGCYVENDMYSTDIGLEILIAVLAAVAGLMAIWTYVICFKTIGFTIPFKLIGKTFGCVLYYGYQVPNGDGTSQLVFIPKQQQKQEDNANIIPNRDTPMYTGIGFSFPKSKQPSPLTNIAPPPYIAPLPVPLNVAPPTDEPAVIAVTMPAQPDKI